MDIDKIWAAILVIVFTLVSGFGDSQGFVHSAKVWDSGKLVWQEVVKSSMGYGIGILMYWFAIRYLKQFGIVSPEIQTLGWFVVTIVGVAIFSGEFFKWQVVDRVVSICVLAGVGWLLFRTGG
jgi:hypothetical protein